MEANLELEKCTAFGVDSVEGQPNNTFDMMADCNAWFDKLAELVIPMGYKVIRSSNPTSNDRYLVPVGTENDLSWNSKPAFSFRVSNHWNWRANKKKCDDDRYIQCYTRDMPWARKRRDDGLATRPMIGCAVAYFTEGREYVVIYGEKFNRINKTWSYTAIDPVDFLKATMEYVPRNDGTNGVYLKMKPKEEPQPETV